MMIKKEDPNGFIRRGPFLNLWLALLQRPILIGCLPLQVVFHADPLDIFRFAFDITLELLHAITADFLFQETHELIHIMLVGKEYLATMTMVNIISIDNAGESLFGILLLCDQIFFGNTPRRKHFPVIQCQKHKMTEHIAVDLQQAVVAFYCPGKTNRFM